AFCLVPPNEPELRLLHRWLDCWRGVGDVVTGMNRQGFWLHLPGNLGKAREERVHGHRTRGGALGVQIARQLELYGVTSTQARPGRPVVSLTPLCFGSLQAGGSGRNSRAKPTKLN